MMCKRCKHVF
ncbi:unnamed protein product [Acanthoscelides obtectus]|uniref:Uncharacterized protein n=1 Tax=Acanthoscelides obtectus TaxID=200917 RepID=A0A9P0LEK6_ACAOB|nr:unnamed protein product [Acanthoscelides obtectus]CAK1682246.1 hypothetical protein AOBTE_LOCUS33508 [Acanthoscelides obtectus]